MLSRRRADSRARLPDGVVATVDTDWPRSSLPSAPLLPADAARHDRPVRLDFLGGLHGSAAAAATPAALDEVGNGWCPARRKEGLVAAAVGLIPSPGSSRMQRLYLSWTWTRGVTEGSGEERERARGAKRSQPLMELIVSAPASNLSLR